MLSQCRRDPMRRALPSPSPGRARMFPTFRAAALAGLMMAAAPFAQAQAPQFSPEQRRAIGEVVKEYLLQNPEVLQEAIVELERRQQEAQKVAQASALKDSREALV